MATTYANTTAHVRKKIMSESKFTHRVIYWRQVNVDNWEGYDDAINGEF